jgi:hypothetical protein
MEAVPTGVKSMRPGYFLYIGESAYGEGGYGEGVYSEGRQQTVTEPPQIQGGYDPPNINPGSSGVVIAAVVVTVILAAALVLFLLARRNKKQIEKSDEIT